MKLKPKLAEISYTAAVTVSGGRVSSASYAYTILSYREGSTVTVSGGTVENTGPGPAVRAAGVYVNGGTVSAKDGMAVYGRVTAAAVSGGFVFAYGFGINDVIGRFVPEGSPEYTGDVYIVQDDSIYIPPEISGAGVACAWNRQEGDPVYAAGTADDLTVSPAGMAVWGKNGEISGIRYGSGTGAGFFPVDGVTVVGEEPSSIPGTPTLTSSSMANFVQANSYTVGLFKDINENAWYGFNQGKDIANAYEYGLMKGNVDNTFNPTGNISVAEAITVAARVHSIYSTGAENFAASSPWHQVYVDYSIANGIITANDFNDFGRAATRAEMAYIFSRSLSEADLTPVNTVNLLPDVNNGTPYYGAIVMLYRAGVLTGNDALGTFSPANNISRAEAAAIISRVILPATRKSGNTFG